MAGRIHTKQKHPINVVTQLTQARQELRAHELRSLGEAARMSLLGLSTPLPSAGELTAKDMVIGRFMMDEAFLAQAGGTNCDGIMAAAFFFDMDVREVIRSAWRIMLADQAAQKSLHGKAA